MLTKRCLVSYGRHAGKSDSHTPLSSIMYWVTAMIKSWSDVMTVVAAVARGIRSPTANSVMARMAEPEMEMPLKNRILSCSTVCRDFVFINALKFIFVLELR